MSDLTKRIKEYFKFSVTEIKNLAICSIIFAFVFAFNSWESLASGIWAMIYLSIFVLISLLIHLSVQKIMALKYGHVAEFEIWWIGIFISLFLVFISNGWIKAIIPGGVFLIFVSRLRIGEFRYGADFLEKAHVSVLGSLSSLFFAVILKSLNSFIQSSLINELILMNIILAIATLLPLPKLNGLSIYFGNRTLYIFTLIFVISTIVFMFLISIWLALLFAIICGAISTFYYSHNYENVL